MSSTTFPSVTAGAVRFTNVSVTDDDNGPVTSFLDQSGQFGGVFKGQVLGTVDRIVWSNRSAGAIGPGSSLTLDFSYDVSNTNAANAITFIQQSFTVDSNQPAGTYYTSLIVTEQVYDLN